MTTDTAPDYLFADALLNALARALHLATPDEAAGLSDVTGEVEPQPEEVVMPFGCVKYLPKDRAVPKIVPQLYVRSKKVYLEHFPYTAEGAALAARSRAAAIAEKEAGGDVEAVKRAARSIREAA